MCGIYSTFGNVDGVQTVDTTNLSKRGPDAIAKLEEENASIMFSRLAIVDTNSQSMQPFDDGTVVLVCNGEIYNHQALISKYNIETKTDSDCEVILHIYKKVGIYQTLRELDGEFAFVLYDRLNKLVFFARDICGVKPLYYGFDEKAITIASLSAGINSVEHVLPRRVYTYDISKHVLSSIQYYTFNTIIPSNTPPIRQLLNDAVVKRLSQSVRPIGFLLSGGLDSSLILSIALESRMLKAKPYVFTFGFTKDCSDVANARIVVDYLRSKYGPDCIDWHCVIEPIENGINALEEVVSSLETYDTTTIRASTPMYLISKYISTHTPVKVLLTGEGSDELFGGYLYFRYSPNKHAFTAEIVSLLENLYLFDVLRADRSTAIHGLEIRPPFLDKALIEAVLVDKDLVPCEQNTKMLLRTACEGLLPHQILYGKKEAFSDAVGLSWKDAITEFAREYVEEHKIIDEKLSPLIQPITDEEIYFQHLFSKHGLEWSLCKKLWLPNQQWVQTGREPSARILKIY